MESEGKAGRASAKIICPPPGLNSYGQPYELTRDGGGPNYPSPAKTRVVARLSFAYVGGDTSINGEGGHPVIHTAAGMNFNRGNFPDVRKVPRAWNLPGGWKVINCPYVWTELRSQNGQNCPDLFTKVW
jgi:hypothetical protein